MFLPARLLMFSLLTLLLSACVNQSFLPSSQLKRALPLPPRYDASAYPSPELRSSLRELFGSSQLRLITERALTNNPDLAGAAARLDEAGFNLKQTHGGLFPTVDGSLTGTRSRQVGPFSGTLGLIGVSLDAAWELDVWGRIRNNISASSSDQAAAAADYRSAQQSLVAQTTQAYFNVVAANKLLALAERQAESLGKTVALTERRFEAGTASLSDLELARTDAINAKADIQQRLEERDSAARNLKVILGDYPDTTLAGLERWPTLRRSVPAGVPASLLRRRPDLDAAYQRLRAADSRVKVAHADLFPTFSLTAGGGRTSTTLVGLTQPAATTWSVGAGLVAPIFASGALRAELGAANSRAVQAYEDYRGVALVAFREVEDALSAEGRLRLEQQQREAALRAAKSAESRARRDFESGISDLLSLLEIQRRVFETEQQTITVRANRYTNRVALALALGKGI